MVLTVYKASAGSGKTHLLTFNYLLLVFSNPLKYRHILAVTFTNKATAEMKDRIVSELFMLSKGEKTEMKAMLMRELPFLDDKGVIIRASIILKHILYDYSSFSVSTIDSFFQRVIRSFAREAGIKYGYNVELDSKLMLKKAIDLMFEDVGKNDDLSNWLIAYTDSQLEGEKGFRIEKNIKTLSEEILKEGFQSKAHLLNEKLQDRIFLTTYLRKLKAITYSYEDRMKKWSREALELIERYGLTVSDFKSGNTSFANHFNKILKCPSEKPVNRFLEALDQPHLWWTASKKEMKEPVEAIYHGGLNEIVRKMIESYNREYKDYKTAGSILKNIYVLGILTDISEKLSFIRNEENLLLISDVNLLLKAVIGENDTPFVYEKTGSRFEHFLIDEFQDTSGFQWDNMKPLVRNSLDEGRENLVVGDVKQSIYRWRAGDWKLLMSKLYEDIPKELITDKKLDTNWRSEMHIVNFNNELFAKASAFLHKSILTNIDENTDTSGISDYASLLEAAYKDVWQQIPEDVAKREGGFVEGFFFPKNDDSGSGFKEKANNKLAEVIDNLLDSGYRNSDLCILVRTNNEGREIAKALLEIGDYQLISKDSLSLSSSTLVSLLLAVMRYISRPDDQVNLLNLLFYNSELKAEEFDFASLANAGQHELIRKHIPDLLKIKELSYYSLIELSEKISEQLALNTFTSELAYLQAFQDVIIGYSNKYAPDLHSFLEWWDDQEGKDSLQINDELDGIRIMTIHKSKGLDFGVVLIPYCNWLLDHRGGNSLIVWSEAKEGVFSELDYVPITYEKALADTHYHTEYYNEKLNTLLDSINALYVAFTRAREGLVFITEDAKTTSTNDIASVLKNTLDVVDGYYFCGKKERLERKKKEVKASIKLDAFNVNTDALSVKVKWDAEDIFDIDGNKRMQLNYGKLMHELLSKIKKADDFEVELQQLLAEGRVSKEEGAYLLQLRDKVFSNELVRDWFSDKWTVRTEAAIITAAGEIRIPDRVLLSGEDVSVIDFKFGQKHTMHVTQIHEYMNVMKELGYKKVSGFLYYAEEDEIIAF